MEVKIRLDILRSFLYPLLMPILRFTNRSLLSHLLTFPFGTAKILKAKAFSSFWVLFFLPIFSMTLLSCKKKEPTCSSHVKIQRIRGLKTLLFEKPLDTQVLEIASQNYYLILNKKYELILSGPHTQTFITDLKHQTGKPAYYIEIDWAGDLNSDCKPDLILWKKPGAYLGEHSNEAPLHKSYQNEKLQVLSVTSKLGGFEVKSLGVY